LSLRNLVISSNNQHKIKEIQNIFGDHFNLLAKNSVQNAPEFEETGTTFLENARLKAIGLSEFTSEWVLADDSGIEIDALDGQPGIYSARFAGDSASDEDNNQKVLRLLEAVPFEKRTAHYQCAIVIAHQGEEIANGLGSCSGIITDHYQGSGGFGYDPLFFDEERQKTFAELTQVEKDKISHRRRALENLLQKIKITS